MIVALLSEFLVLVFFMAVLAAEKLIEFLRKVFLRLIIMNNRVRFVRLQIGVKATQLLNTVESILRLKLKDTPANLEADFLARLHRCWFLKENKCAKL